MSFRWHGPPSRWRQQAFIDEIVLTGFRLLRSAPDATRLEWITREVIAALEFYGQQGWLDKSEGFFAAPPALTDVTVRTVNNMGRTCERMFFDSGYEPHAGEPGRERWLSYTGNNREYGLMLRHRQPRPWLVCVHGAEMGRAALDPTLFRAWHLLLRSRPERGASRASHARAPRAGPAEGRRVPQRGRAQPTSTVRLRRCGISGAC